MTGYHLAFLFKFGPSSWNLYICTQGIFNFDTFTAVSIFMEVLQLIYSPKLQSNITIHCQTIFQNILIIKIDNSCNRVLSCWHGMISPYMNTNLSFVNMKHMMMSEHKLSCVNKTWPGKSLELIKIKHLSIIILINL